MRREQWEAFARAARGLPGGCDGPLAAFIVDSPWIPGFAGMSHLDYFTLPDRWLAANLMVEERFPQAVMIPGAWVEYGMAAEPSAFGCRISWREDATPSVAPVLRDLSDADRLTVPEPRTDGLMPFVLSLYRGAEAALAERGQAVRMVAARGPLALAAHLRGVTELLTDLKLCPAETRRLLEITTETVIRWLRAQASNLGSVEGVLVLDDIVGFLSPEDYREFAHPALAAVFSSFPGMVKVFHDDYPNGRIMADLADAGFDVLNFSHTLDIGVVREATAGKVRLMGNVPPRDVMANGTPAEVSAWARECIDKTDGGRGLILSAGGGLSPGTPAANIDALVRAARPGTEARSARPRGRFPVPL
jgi:uroporphyrinogen decarboxylase